MATIKTEDGITIVLTEEQLRDIERQRSTPKTGKDIKSYEIACKYLGETPDPGATATRKLKTMIKAANRIDNGGKDWDFDYNVTGYLPYFNKTRSGLVFYGSRTYCFDDCLGQVEMYFKNKSTSDYFGTEHIVLYNQWSKE